MFSLRNFIKKGLMDAIGQMADYQVILNAAGWQQKGVLLDEDLAEIDTAITAKNTPVESEVLPEEMNPEMPVEEKKPSLVPDSI